MIYADAANILADMQEEDSWYNDTTGSFDIQQYLKVMMDDHDHHEVDVFNSMIYDDEEDHSEDEDEDDAPQEKKTRKKMGKDAKGKPSSPLELLILGAFRYLGRGLTFDDLEESTAISEEVHRKFFHKFIKIGSTVLYDRYVRAPQTKEEVQQHMHEFATAGLPGAFASTDATNIIHELCNWKNRRAHIGFKSKHACRTYNTTVNHRRRILASTFGNPGSFNDKTLILFDTFIRDIKRGEKLDDYTFELLERRGEEVVAVQYKGVWIVVDNGYHNWSTTVPQRAVMRCCNCLWII
jgi:hypothetical protein